MRRLVFVLVAVIASSCSDSGRVTSSVSGNPDAARDVTRGDERGAGCTSHGPTPAISEMDGEDFGDFDGDTWSDTVKVYRAVPGARDATALDLPRRIRIEFAAGGVTDEELPEGGEIESVVDVNGDGRAEVIVDLGGNTGFSVEFATVVGCRVGVALGPDGLSAGFGYYGHSTTYPGSVGTHCLDSDGNGQLDQVVQVASEPVFRDVNGDGLRDVRDRWHDRVTATEYYTWERETYAFEAGHFRLLKSTAGRYKRDVGQLELSNDLVCERPFPG